MDPDDDARAPGLWPRSGGGGAGAHDRCGVFLSADEQRRFEEIVAPMWLLRMTRGRRASFLGRGWTYLVLGISGIVISLAALGTLPVVVSFAGFVLAVVTLTEFSRNVADSGWWRRARRLLGLEAASTPDRR